MSSPNARCSDLDLARQLSTRLIGAQISKRTDGSDPSTVYARFASVPQTVEEGLAVPKPGSEEPSPEAVARLRPPVQLDSWDMILAWGMEVAEARAAFIVDSQGFVIASRGNPPEGGFDGVGAELCYVMEQVESMDDDSGAVKTLELEFVNRRLIAVRGKLTDASLVSVGFITSARPSGEVLEVLQEQFTRWLEVRL